MKFSTKGRYGIRAMIDLAVYSNGEHVSLYNIAERQGISTNYLEHVFATLRKAGLVKSVKGAQGGYVLSDPPSKIKIGTILRALEGELTVTDEDNESERRKTLLQECLKRFVWDKMNEYLNDIVDSVTLEDLAEDYKKKNGLYSAMYYI